MCERFLVVIPARFDVGLEPLAQEVLPHLVDGLFDAGWHRAAEARRASELRAVALRAEIPRRDEHKPVAREAERPLEAQALAALGPRHHRMAHALALRVPD